MNRMDHVQLTKASKAMRGPDVTQERLFSIRQTADFVPNEVDPGFRTGV